MTASEISAVFPDVDDADFNPFSLQLTEYIRDDSLKHSASDMAGPGSLLIPPSNICKAAGN